MAELLNTNIVASGDAGNTSVLNVKKNNKNSILDIRENGDIIITTADGIKINIAKGAINVSKDGANVMTVANNGDISFTKFPTSNITPSISIDNNKIKLTNVVNGINAQGKVTYNETINSVDLGSLTIGSTTFKVGETSAITENDILKLDGKIPYVNVISSTDGSNGGSKKITRTLNTNNSATPVLDNIVISGGNLTGNENKAVKLDGDGHIISSGYILGSACAKSAGYNSDNVPIISLALNRKKWVPSFNR